MAITICWSPKGGTGTTVVVAGIALASDAPTVIVDLVGEVPAALGIAEPAGQGLTDWFASASPPAAVADLSLDVDHTTTLIPLGAGSVDRQHERWGELAAWMASDRRHFVVDAGSSPPPTPLTAAGRSDDVASAVVRELLVLRPCYLALRRACALRARPDGIVLVDDHHHSLRGVDIANSIGAPVVAEVSVDPAVARAVDAGILAFRLPASIARPLRALGLAPSGDATCRFERKPVLHGIRATLAAWPT